MAQTFPLHKRIKGTIAALRANYSKSAAEAALADLEAALELAPPGQWIFPRPADMLEPVSPEMASLVHGALNFSSDAKHTSDYVMAWWICWLQMAKDEGLSLT